MFRYSKKENLWSTKQSSQSYHPKKTNHIAHKNLFSVQWQYPFWAAYTRSRHRYNRLPEGLL